MKDHVEIGHLTKYDAFRMNRDQVMDRTFEEELETGTGIERLAWAGLKLKPKKCFLFQKRVSQLGHVVTEEDISVDPR